MLPDKLEVGFGDGLGFKALLPVCIEAGRGLRPPDESVEDGVYDVHAPWTIFAGQRLGEAAKGEFRRRQRGEAGAALDGGRCPGQHDRSAPRVEHVRQYGLCGDRGTQARHAPDGFEVIDRKEGNSKDADVVVIGEGFSQFASRHGNLVSVKARLEVKALDRASGKVLAVDRQTSVAVDLAEHIAGKTALQDAAVSIAERLLPKLCGPAKEKGKRK